MKYTSNMLISMSDDDILWAFVQHLKDVHPKIKIGDFMSGPVEYVWEGRKITPFQYDASKVVRLAVSVPHVKRPSVLVTALTRKLKFSDFNTWQWEDPNYLWVYPYEASVPHRDLLTKYKVGDEVMALDDQHEYSPVVLTEEIMKAHHYLYVRYAVVTAADIVAATEE